MNATRRDRIATPSEFAVLLAALESEDALPYALAGYGMGRRAQIQYLRWRDVGLRLGLIEWGVRARCPKVSLCSAGGTHGQAAPRHAHANLERSGGTLWESFVCPPRRSGGVGLLHTGGLAVRVKKAWEAKELQPIGLHECRHTAATRLDAVGVSPKVASVLMGHAIPDRQPGAAEITLARYTHVMPGAIETARAQLDRWLEAELPAQQMRSSARRCRLGGRLHKRGRSRDGRCLRRPPRRR